jgi:hypothetical protein
MRGKAKSKNVDGRRKGWYIGGKQRKKKKLSLTQAYTKLYWKVKVEDLVNKRWKVKWLEDNPDFDANDPFQRIPRPDIGFRNRVVQALYDSEPKEIKTAVQDYRETTREQSDSSDNEESDETGERKKIKAMQT